MTNPVVDFITEFFSKLSMNVLLTQLQDPTSWAIWFSITLLLRWVIFTIPGGRFLANFGENYRFCIRLFGAKLSNCEIDDYNFTERKLEFERSDNFSIVFFVSFALPAVISFLICFSVIQIVNVFINLGTWGTIILIMVFAILAYGLPTEEDFQYLMQTNGVFVWVLKALIIWGFVLLWISESWRFTTGMTILGILLMSYPIMPTLFNKQESSQIIVVG